MSFLDGYGLFGPPNVEKHKAKGGIKGLIEALHYKKSDFVSWKAVQALGEIKDSRAVEPLIAAIKNSNCEVRGNAEG